ncbi:MAG: SPOR domain-containing protein [Chitinophagaceae bacterium]
MKKVLGFLLLLTALKMQAQTDTNSIVVHKDPRIDLLVKKHVEANEFNTRESRRYAQGFRILVINTNDRNKAMNAKSKIYQEMPDLKVYLTYQAPFYKLKVGNYKDREEAEQALPSIQRIFSSGVYVVMDVIEVNPDKSAELQ